MSAMIDDRKRMRLLDLFCGAGGAAMGYHRAGFEVIGVDHLPQPHYLFEFVLADALEYCAMHGREFDVIHASPPCQAYSVTAALSNGKYPRLIEATRQSLQATGKPYVIENVPGAPLLNPLMLCGTMFDLHVIRHRLFECFPVIWWPPRACHHVGKATGNSSRNRRGYGRTIRLSDGYQYVSVCGNDYIKADAELAMGINWMRKKDLSQAIPPAYTEWLGRQLIARLELPHV